MFRISDKQHKKRFWLKISFLILPFLPLIAAYFIFDPYMVLHKYKRFDKSISFLNEAYVGWQTYLANRDSLGYNAFIMGNSATMAFKTQEWEKYLSGNRALRFYDNAETLGGLCQKLQALDDVGASIKNLLVILEPSSFESTLPLSGYKHIFPSKVTGMNEFSFQLYFIQAFIYPSYLIPYMDYRIFGKWRPYMKGIITPTESIREPFTNNFINPREKEIAQVGERYWVNRQKEFGLQLAKGKELNRVIVSKEQLDLLHTIQAICKKHGTRLKIVLSPEYHQEKVNHQDLQVLKSIFGEKAVWDFTGVNAYTSDIHNYYEPGHYRPMLGARLLKEIYCSNDTIKPKLSKIITQ